MKLFNRVYYILFVLFVLFSACQKPAIPNYNVDAKLIFYSSTVTTADLIFNFISSGTISKVQVSISTNSNFSDALTTEANFVSDGLFKVSFSNLSSSTRYYCKVKCCNSYSSIYLDEIFEFETQDLMAPEVVTYSATDVKITSAVLNANFISEGTNLLESGFWVEGNFVVDGEVQYTSIYYDCNSSANSSRYINYLMPNETYTYYAYAKNSVGEAVGEVVSFTTLSISAIEFAVQSIDNITHNSAQAHCYIYNNYDLIHSERGICISSENTHPSILETKIIDRGVIGSYTINLTLLKPSTLYWVRPYFMSDFGIVYGDVITFSTLAVPPVISIQSVDAITDNAITFSCAIEKNDNYLIEQGICFSTNQLPKVSNSKQSFLFNTCTVSGLQSQKNYYFRPYLIVGSGDVFYGDEIVVKTL